MVRYKVNNRDDDGVFVETSAYKRLYIIFKDLKNHKGRIIHVVGAPGTGKSANIYQAINALDLDVFEAELSLDNPNKSWLEVYREFFNTLRRDMRVKIKKECYEKAAEYDAVLWADRFHDSQLIYDDKFGFSVWMDHKGLKSFPFYLALIFQYLRNFFKFRSINLIFQTSWTIRLRGVKQDLFTDFGYLSKFLVLIMKIFFKVVVITYTESEIIEIVKEHLPDAHEQDIILNRKKYGSRIRFILQSLKNGEL